MTDEKNATILEAAKATILEVLEADLKAQVNQITSEDAQSLVLIADDAARYAVRLAAGDEGAAQLLAHCKVQAQLLASRVWMREQKQIQETLEKIITVVTQTVTSLLLKAVLV